MKLDLKWGKPYTEEFQEKAIQLAMALNCQGIQIDKVASLQILATLRVVDDLKWQFSLEDAAELEVEFENIRKEAFKHEQAKASGKAADK